MIDSFRGDHRWLSNFHYCQIWYEDEYDGRWYPSTEHAYQAAKSVYPVDRKMIAGLKKAADSKCEGRKLPLRQDWEKVKLQVMYDVVHWKFFNDKALAEKLLATGDEELMEGNTHGDRVWGCTKTGQGPWVGENHLGKILMRVREELKCNRAKKLT